MLTETFLDRIPIWLLYLGTVTFLLAGCELGYRVSTWHKATRTDGEKAPANAMMGSTLGLLAFMLAFTFGMSSSRFDARKQLVLEDASAILRTYERVQFLPEPQRIESSRLLRDYLELRLRMTKLKNLEEMNETVLRSEAIQEDLWKQLTLQLFFNGVQYDLNSINDFYERVKGKPCDIEGAFAEYAAILLYDKSKN